MWVLYACWVKYCLGAREKRDGVGENFESALSHFHTLESWSWTQDWKAKASEFQSEWWIVGGEDDVREDKIRDAAHSCDLSAEPLGCVRLRA